MCPTAQPSRRPIPASGCSRIQNKAAEKFSRSASSWFSVCCWSGLASSATDGFEQAYVISEEATADLVGLSRLREPLSTVGA